MLDLDGIDADGYERGRNDGLEERRVLQRRIKNQRKALKRLSTHVNTQLRMLEGYRAREPLIRSQTYRHAAAIAEKFWLGGPRIADYLRKCF